VSGDPPGPGRVDHRGRPDPGFGDNGRSGRSPVEPSLFGFPDRAVGPARGDPVIPKMAEARSVGPWQAVWG
jgi:hypothetical protein